ncbi:MAG: Uma2 family endonuclease [Acidimicrobiales bacterium]
MPELTRYAFTVDEWHRMGEAGLFDEDARVELLDGEVYQMAAIGNAHLACVNRLTRLLVAAAGDRAIVSVQNPIRLDNHSEPQPDLVLLQPRPDDYATATPTARDAFLVIEVADSSLEWDRDRKAPRYAQAEAPACWIVDLNTGEILVLTGPTSEGFQDLHRARRGEVLAVPGLTGAQIVVDQVLGSA